MLENLDGKMCWKCWVEMLVGKMYWKCWLKMLVNGCEIIGEKIVATNLPLRHVTTMQYVNMCIATFCKNYRN